MDLDVDDYLCNITNGLNAQFLTDMKTNYVSIYNLGWHHILTNTPTDIDSLAVITYDSSGAVIQTVVKANSVAQNLTTSRMYKVATSPEALNNMTGAFISGAQPVITSSVYRYTVQLVDTGGNPASELLNFYLEDDCDYTQMRLHFLNRLGSFDSFNFNFQSNTTRSVERKTMKYNPYPVNSNGLVRSHSERSQIQHYVKTQDTIKLRSRYLSEEENDWLKQLIESPEIYLEFTDASGVQNLKAVESIVESNWESKTLMSDKLFPLDVTIKLSQNNFRQTR
jgi:hypothetical protein